MATISQLDPFNLSKVQQDLNRWFDDRLSYGRAGGESIGWTPACDIYEDAEGVTLSFDLPRSTPKKLISVWRMVSSLYVASANWNTRIIATRITESSARMAPLRARFLCQQPWMSTE